MNIETMTDADVAAFKAWKENEAAAYRGMIATAHGEIYQAERWLDAQEGELLAEWRGTVGKVERAIVDESGRVVRAVEEVLHIDDSKAKPVQVDGSGS